MTLAGAPHRRKVLLLGLGVALLVVGAHAPALRGELVWLDHHDVVGRRALAPPSAWGSLFTRSFAGAGFYRPATALSLSVDAAVAGTSPAAAPLYRAHTLLLHVGVSLAAAAALAILLQLPAAPALLGGLAVGLHPMSTLPVGVAAYRTDVLALLFALLALLLHHRATRSTGRAGLLAAAGAGVCLFWALLSKETALLVGPGLLALHFWSDRHRQPSGAPSARTAAWLCEAAAVALYLGVRALVLDRAWRVPGFPLPPGEALGTRLANLAHEGGRLLLPIDARLSDVTPVTGLFSAGAAAGAVLLAAAALLLGQARRWPRLALATAMLLLGLLPLSHLVPLAHFRSLHYLYLPALGVGALLAIAWEAGHPARRIAVLGWLALALAVTAVRSSAFTSDERLFAPEVLRQPAFREAQAFLGDQALRSGDLDTAERRYQAALQPVPGLLAYVNGTAVQQNLALVFLRRGRPVEAEALLERTLLSIDAGQAEVERQLRHNLALLVLARRDPRRVVELLLPEARRSDARPASLVTLGQALGDLGRYPEALQLFRRAEPGLEEPERGRIQEVLRRAARRPPPR